MVAALVATGLTIGRTVRGVTRGLWRDRTMFVAEALEAHRRRSWPSWIR